ncbi:hypothetical protein NM688_g788 [Phlebia brevispora]|uniref:Uncharacterized protein n=1 Tax=Phlebia brevispora TaxID=194682 RepID=A0ACC1TDF9_9APHY|nr:hypothetical protein NM688_g788 [Phlebia brevispora]
MQLFRRPSTKDVCKLSFPVDILVLQISLGLRTPVPTSAQKSVVSYFATKQRSLASSYGTVILSRWHTCCTAQTFCIVGVRLFDDMRNAAAGMFAMSLECMKREEQIHVLIHLWGHDAVPVS